MTNDPFKTHGINHQSPSSTNLFISNPSQWILRYLFGLKWEGNPATARGNVVDKATGRSQGFKKNKDNKWVRRKKRISLKKNIELSLEEYDSLINDLKKYNKGELDESKVEAERESLPKFIETSVSFYKELIDPNEPVEYQQRIELQFEQLPTNIIGYLDLECEDTVRDIKTVKRVPSVVPSSVCRQLAVYAAATGKTPIVDYVCVTKTKAEVVPMVVNDVDKYLEEVKRAAITIMNVLSYSNDINEIAKLYYPDLDDWKWTDRERELARQIWS